MDVQSYVLLSANAGKVGSRKLPPAEYVEDVRAFPKEVPGLERKYLEALQKNVRARREYDVLLQKPAQQPQALGVEVQSTSLAERIELLRLKRRYEELQILQRYMTRLKKMAVARPDFGDLKRLQRHELDSLSAGRQCPNAGVDQAEESDDVLVRQLEMTVICAKHRVDHERRLLAEAEQDVGAAPAPVKQSNRLSALTATRDELVSWMDGKLSSSQADENGITDDGLEEQQTESPIPQLQHEIMEKYDEYIRLRKRLLDLTGHLAKSIQHSPLTAEASESKADPPPLSSCPPTPCLLPFIQTHIRHPTRLHQFHRQQTNHLTSLINQERSKTTSELSRLADEGHLLLSYPMLAQQDQFKHATATVTSKPLPSYATSSDEQDEMSRRVQAWSLAAGAARVASEKIVEEHLAEGGEAVGQGETWIERLRMLLGDDDDLRQEERRRRNGNGVEDEEADEEGEDVWTLEAAVDPPKRRKRAVERTKGLWAGLQGDLGLEKGI